MRYIFSQLSDETFSDTSKNETLAFDMKTREIKINGYKGHPMRAAIEILPVSLDDLFDNSFQQSRHVMFFSEIVFRFDPFVEIIRKLTDLNYSGKINFGSGNKIPIGVTAPYYHDIIDEKASSRTIVKTDFVRLLIGQLNNAQYWIFCHQLRNWEIGRVKYCGTTSECGVRKRHKRQTGYVRTWEAY